MNETIGFLVIGAGFAIVGGVIGWIVYVAKNKSERAMKKILNDPELLVAEIKKHGKIYDVGKDNIREEVDFVVQTNEQSGKKSVGVVRRRKIQPPKQKKEPEENPSFIRKKVKKVRRSNE